MRYFLTFLLILIAGVLQITVAPVNILLLIVLDLGIILNFRQGLMIGFLSGLILDLFSLGRLGYSSLIFLIIVFLVNLYKRRWTLPNFWLVLILTFVFGFFFKMMVREFWSIKQGLILVLVNAIFYSVVSFLQRQEFGGPLKLRL